MYMQTEKTPNPSALKFIPGPKIVETPIDFPSMETARMSPIALRLFSVAGVTSVFLSHDFITVTKAEDISWDEIQPTLSAYILAHLAAGKPILSDTAPFENSAEPSLESDDAVTKDIKDIIDTRVRPAVARDGGDIVFEKFDAGVVYLRLKGACSGCPSSTITLKSGIENMLRYYVPEVKEVRAADE
ncbi:MAG: NifU family protein [Holosporaceae bacterium]|nr:MAG: NifU family protein [Holosporaceae bacterium]